MNIPILYEDDELLVANKPAGIVVNRAQSVKEETIQDWMQKKSTNLQSYESTSEDKDFYDRAGIVHRLDKETSGILLIAKTPDAFKNLQAQFKERSIKKTYLAVAHGKIVPKEGEIHAPVDRLPWQPEHFGIVAGGKDSVTGYSVVTYITSPDAAVRKGKKESAQEMLSVVELSPLTGRTHQIRVHLKYIGHPIVGDYLYAGRKTSRRDRVWAPRVMLHAWKLTGLHPKTGKKFTIESPIPDDMQGILNKPPSGKLGNT